MEIKRRDLGQAKEPEKRESTIDVLRRLKAQEGKGTEKRDPFILEKGDDGFPTVKTLPESNIISLLSKIEALEREMKGGDNYLSLYYDMKNLEEKFVRMAEQIERHNFQVSADTKKRILLRKEKIEAKKKQ
ncbi:MAG: hypothetical protein V1645_01855 [archaeon]